MNTIKTNIAYIPNTGLIFDGLIYGDISGITEIMDTKINDKNVLSHVAKNMVVSDHYVEYQITFRTFQDYDAANEWIRPDDDDIDA